jgi:hypothetical protein
MVKLLLKHLINILCQLPKIYTRISTMLVLYLIMKILFKCVSSNETEDITKSLKIKNSHGYNEILTRILKSSIYYISSPLTYICNRRKLSGTFPTRLKFSEVKRMFKKGNKKDTSIYLTIDLFRYLHHFQRFFKRSFIIEQVVCV